MKWVALSLVAAILAFGLYRFNVGVTYTRDLSITASDFECYKMMVSVTMDNPIERLPLTSVHFYPTDSGSVIATAYFIVLPYSKFEISPGCTGARRL